MSQPTRTSNVPDLNPAILRRLGRRAASHDFDVIGDAPPPAAEEAPQPLPKAASAPAATRAAE